jgi:hypothetical protein
MIETQYLFWNSKNLLEISCITHQFTPISLFYNFMRTSRYKFKLRKYPRKYRTTLRTTKNPVCQISATDCTTVQILEPVIQDIKFRLWKTKQIEVDEKAELHSKMLYCAWYFLGAKHTYIQQNKWIEMIQFTYNI